MHSASEHMLLSDEVREWCDRFVASFVADGRNEEAEFWLKELSDPWAAGYWYDEFDWDQPIEKADLVQLV